MKETIKLINGNNIDILKTYPDNYFDAVVTDPPYGLGKEPNAEALMKDWIEKGYHEIKGTGFMGKEWDAFIPQPIFWKEVFRVLKHGGHVLSFFGTRTYDWGVMSMRFAGFEVRDCIQWLYGSGFPKSHNISKALDKMEGAEREVIGKANHLNKGNSFNIQKGWNKNSLKSPDEVMITAPSTDSAKQWDGWGTALKPANEPIVLARKPLEKGLSIAENILKWGVGGINIDGCRVGTEEIEINGSGKKWRKNGSEIEYVKEPTRIINQGRFPANIILTHHEDCECKGTKKVKSDGNFPKTQNTESWKMASKGKALTPENDYADENGNETIENWDCHEDCPIRILDEQSGISKTGDIKPYKSKSKGTIYGNGKGYYTETRTADFKGDKGGASRFFYVAKASKSERNKGLNDSNFHPTVKPIKLMQYLVKMITPPNGIVLDPFCGSGTTGIACKLDGFQFIGLEQDPEYSKIAEARIENSKLKTNQLNIF